MNQFFSQLWKLMIDFQNRTEIEKTIYIFCNRIELSSIICRNIFVYITNILLSNSNFSQASSSTLPKINLESPKASYGLHSTVTMWFVSRNKTMYYQLSLSLQYPRWLCAECLPRRDHLDLRQYSCCYVVFRWFQFLLFYNGKSRPLSYDWFQRYDTHPDNLIIYWNCSKLHHVM